MNNPINPDELIQRVADLEAQLKRVTMERDIYKETLKYPIRDSEPFVPPTEEELEDMVNGPRGEPISQIIEELERELGVMQ